VGEASEVLRSLLGDAGFGCGLHVGLWCGRFLDLHRLSRRNLFFFAGRGEKDEERQGFCRLRLKGCHTGAQEGPVPPCGSPAGEVSGGKGAKSGESSVAE
jgi:hypothetical protein